jgi:hypothetical protein
VTSACFVKAVARARTLPRALKSQVGEENHGFYRAHTSRGPWNPDYRGEKVQNTENEKSCSEQFAPTRIHVLSGAMPRMALALRAFVPKISAASVDVHTTPPRSLSLFKMPLDTSTYSLALLRLDGRRWNELRRIHAQISTQAAADGSSYFEMGNTKVLCTVTGPAEGRQSGQRGGKDNEAKVEVEIGFAGFSGVERRKRKTDKYVRLQFQALNDS